MDWARRIAVVLILFCSPVYSMQWYEAYEEGRKQVDKGNCERGAPLLLEALQRQPKEDTRARPYGVITIEYIPRYYLLKCAMQSGDLESAGNYIKEADSAGAVSQSKKSSAYYALKTQYTQEKNKLAQKQQEEKQKPPDQPPPPPPEDPAVKQRQLEMQRQAEIQRSLADARQALYADRLDEARRNAQKVLAMDPQNDPARKILLDIQERETSQRVARDKQRRLDAISDALSGGNLSSAENLALQYQDQYPDDPYIQQTLSEIRKRKSQVQPQPPPQPPPTENAQKSAEKLVVIAFLKGNYEAVIQLVEINEAKFHNSWRLPYYRGCAYASLAMLDEKQREEFTTRARESFRAAKQRSGNIPDNPYISPKILEIFRSS